MLLAEIAAASDDVRATTARSAKIARLADCIGRLAPEELAAGVAFLSGELRQRQIGAGWAALRDLPPPTEAPSLSVLDADAAFACMATAAGAGSQGHRRMLLDELFASATDREQHLLRGLVAGELRQGAQAGVLVDAVARTTGVGTADIRRALMLRGDLGMVAEIARNCGDAGLRELRIKVGRPLLPMLAQTAGDLAGGLERLGPAAIEWKLDGARVQIHKSPGAVAVFTRTLDDITERVPELVAAAAAVAADAAVLDGEAIGLRADGRPLPFQVTARRIASTRNVAGMAERIPLSLVLFDALHIDGDDLLDRPSGDRSAALEAVAPGLTVPRLVEPDPHAAAAFLADALARGHEGVMLKALDQPYESGRRGAGWLKLKPAHTLDLVVLAAEWGHGRRTGSLSNLHLGARTADGGFVMLGKTFKGLTDRMLAWQTERLLELEVSRDRTTVHVRPELVVEVAFDGVQTSPRYPGGVALRFARVKSHRPDKRAQDADTIEQLLAIHSGS